jgi:hypothetical protein
VQADCRSQGRFAVRVTGCKARTHIHVNVIGQDMLR